MSQPRGSQTESSCSESLSPSSPPPLSPPPPSHVTVSAVQANIRQLKAGLRMVPSLAALGRRCTHMLVVRSVLLTHTSWSSLTSHHIFAPFISQGLPSPSLPPSLQFPSFFPSSHSPTLLMCIPRNIMSLRSCATSPSPTPWPPPSSCRHCVPSTASSTTPRVWRGFSAGTSEAPPHLLHSDLDPPRPTSRCSVWSSVSL